MAHPTVQPGFIGIATIEGRKIRCTSFDVNPNQTSLFYDHTIGIRDTVPITSATKGEQDPLTPHGSNVRNTQKRIWRPSTIEVSGGISFPATVLDSGYSFCSRLFNIAGWADYFDLDFWYYCGNGKTFSDCRVNTFGFNIQAGDILNIDASVMGKDIADATPPEVFHKEAEKLVTWDVVNITVSGYTPLENLLITGFNFQINNNLSNIYTNGSVAVPNLKPHDIRAGMQEVTGSLSIYLEQGQEFIPISLTTPAEIAISCPSLNTTMHVVFQSNKMSGAIGPIVTEIPFVGVDKYFYGGDIDN